MIWLPVVGFETLYEVSDSGEVWSLRKGRLMRPYISGSGYPSLHLYADGRRTVKSVHQLVMEAFSPSDGMQVNHKNCNKLDNRLENLEWVSPKGNISHARDHGRLCGPKNPASGERNGSVKLAVDAVVRIRALRGKARQVDVAREFGVSQALVSKIQRGDVWRLST